MKGRSHTEQAGVKSIDSSDEFRPRAHITLFKTAHGLTPHAFLLQCRIEAAKRLLEDGFSVKAVADRFGFPSTQHFSRTFRNFVGVSPAKWRGGSA